MRVLIVNTSEKTGGAAVAANRLVNALNNNGVKAKMLVRKKETDSLTVVGLPQSLRLSWNFLWERWCIFWHLHFSRRHLFEIDIANIGTDITSLPEFQEADVIHLHWINQGMLSLKGIQKILDSGKPVVWTMHDLWPATAICHYAHDCLKFTTGCNYCQLLPNGGSRNDLSAKCWKKKFQILNYHHVTFVACSEWLGKQAKESMLLKNSTVVSIPNAINSNVFCKMGQRGTRSAMGLPTDKRLILFVSQRVTDPRKGMNYFVKAIEKLVAEYSGMREDTGIALLGSHSYELEDKLALPVYPLGYVSDTYKIVEIYNAVDLFVLPSLSDNLPNTIMEAMSCGVPCVGFKVGGIPEMIDHHENGYVAEFQDADDLAKGIHWVLEEADYSKLSEHAVKKVARSYSQQSVAAKYLEVYNQALASKRLY